MPAARTFVALLLCCSLAAAADLRTLKGETVSGDLVKLTDAEVTLKQGEETTTTPTAQALQLELNPLTSLVGVKYIAVELIDGSLLACSQATIKGDKVHMTLLPGQTLQIDLDKVAYILNDAHEEDYRKEWKDRFLSKKRTKDLLVLRSKKDKDNPNSEEVRNGLEGTLGKADDKGESIEFILTSGKTQPVSLSRVHGLAFLRPVALAVPSRYKVFDTQQSLLMALTTTMTATGFTVETPAGLKVEYTRELISRFDYSKGKLAFLSDLDPATVVEKSTEDRIEHYRRNQNLDGNKFLRLAGKNYTKGLALHSHTELEYDLKGEFREFRAMVGIDEQITGSDGTTIVRLFADGKLLRDLQLSRKDKEKVHELALTIKDVQRLKIVVTSGDLLDLGKHAVLADARVSK